MFPEYRPFCAQLARAMDASKDAIESLREDLMRNVTEMLKKDMNEILRLLRRPLPLHAKEGAQLAQGIYHANPPGPRRVAAASKGRREGRATSIECAPTPPTNRVRDEQGPRALSHSPAAAVPSKPKATSLPVSPAARESPNFIGEGQPRHVSGHSDVLFICRPSLSGEQYTENSVETRSEVRLHSRLAFSQGPSIRKAAVNVTSKRLSPPSTEQPQPSEPGFNRLAKLWVEQIGEDSSSTDWHVTSIEPNGGITKAYPFK